MSFKIIQGDISEISVDAIVNTANPLPLYSTGTDSAIYRKAGPKLLEDREKIGFIHRGDVALTKGYRLSARYVIHAVGTYWMNGTGNEIEILRSCYWKSLMCAFENHCKSLAFPLLATGNYNFPRTISMYIAVQECTRFLLNHSDYDITIYLVVFDPQSVKLAKALIGTFPHTLAEQDFLRKIMREYQGYIPFSIVSSSENIKHSTSQNSNRSLQEILQEERVKNGSPENLSLRKALQRFIEEKGIKPSQLYNSIGMSCQTFSNMYDKGITPKKENLRKIAIGLQLDYEEAKYLFSQAGYVLKPNNPVDEIMVACFRNHFYKLDEIDSALEDVIGKTYFAIK